MVPNIRVDENKEIYGIDDVINLRRDLNPSNSRLEVLICLWLKLSRSI